MLAFGLPSSCTGFVHATTVSVSSYCNVSAVFDKHCRHSLSLALTIFLFTLPKWYLSHHRRSIIELLYLELSIAVSYSLHVAQFPWQIIIWLWHLHHLRVSTETQASLSQFLSRGLMASCPLCNFTQAVSCHRPPGLNDSETVEKEYIASLLFLSTYL